MKVLSLFTGGGLGDFGLEKAGMEIIGQVEIDEYCQKILALRWPEIPRRRNIRRVGKKFLKECGQIDLISGGFPCQPFSYAGKKHGSKDDRNLWPEMYRIIREVRPKWVVAENVPGIIEYLDAVVLPQMESLGYWNYRERTGEAKIAPFIVPASAFGAPHIRQRVWIVAHAQSIGRDDGFSAHVGSIDREGYAFGDSGTILADTDGPRKPQQARSIKKFGDGLIVGSKALSHASSFGGDRRLAEPGQATSWRPHPEASRCSWWTTEPRVGRVVNGTPRRMDRLKLLGNGQVVQVVEWIGKQIMRYESELKK